MKTSSTVILFLVLSLSIPSVRAQDTIPVTQTERVSLKLNLSPQSSYRFISNSTQRAEQEILGTAMETNIETTVHYRFEVEHNTGEEIKIKASYERLAIQMQMPQDTLHVDTDNEMQQNNSASFDKLASLVNQPFYIFLDDQGKISKLEGLSEGVTDEVDDAASLIQGSLNGRHFLSEIEKAFYIFPEDSVSMGETWRFSQEQRLNHQINLQLEKAFTMEGLSEDLAWINIDHHITSTATSSSLGDINLVGTQKGTIELDRESGLIFFSESNQELEGLIQTHGIDVPLKISSTNTLHGEKL